MILALYYLKILLPKVQVSSGKGPRKWETRVLVNHPTLALSAPQYSVSYHKWSHSNGAGWVLQTQLDDLLMDSSTIGGLWTVRQTVEAH